MQNESEHNSKIAGHDDDMFQAVVVIGGGRMGRGITLWMLLHGRSVTLIEANAVRLEESRQEIDNFFERRITKGFLTQDSVHDMMTRLQMQADYSDLEDTDLVIESVAEDIGMKRHIYAELCQAVSSTTIIASNASSIEVSRLAEFVDNPGRLLGTHFFYPVVANPIVELIRGNKSDPGLLRKLKAFFTHNGKTPITSKDSPGFVVNRFIAPYINTAYWLMEKMQLSGATIDEISIPIFGSRQGPIEVSNMLGVHNVYRDQMNISKIGHFYTPSQGLVSNGKDAIPTRLGDAEPLSEAQQAEIRDQLLGSIFYPILQILDEGISTPEDIDLAARLGLRFEVPPCALMDQIGIDAVRSLLHPINEAHGDGMPISLEDVGQLRPDLQQNDAE